MENNADQDKKNVGFSLLYGGYKVLPREEAPLLTPDRGPSYRFPDKIDGEIVYMRSMSGDVLISHRPLLPGGSPRLFVRIPRSKAQWTAAHLWEVLRVHAAVFDEGVEHGQQHLCDRVRELLGDARDPAADMPQTNKVVIDEERKGGVYIKLSSGLSYGWTLIGDDWSRDEIEDVIRFVWPQAFASGVEQGRSRLASKMRQALEQPEKSLDGLTPSVLDRVVGPPGRDEMRRRLAAMRKLDPTNPSTDLVNLKTWASSVAQLLPGLLADMDRLLAPQGEVDTLVSLAMVRAIAAFGGEDGVFNRAGFQTAFDAVLGFPGTTTSTMAAALLGKRADVEVLAGGAHYRWAGLAPVPGAENAHARV